MPAFTNLEQLLRIPAFVQTEAATQALAAGLARAKADADARHALLARAFEPGLRALATPRLPRGI